MQANTLLVRNLIPKSYHFDGYNEFKCPNSRDRPFFADNVIALGDYNLTTRLENPSNLLLEFESVCKEGKLTFEPFKLSLEDYVSKLQKAVQEGSDYITFEITPKYYCDKHTCVKCSSKRKDCVTLVSKHPKQIYAAVSFNTSEVKEALASYFKITNLTGGKPTMKKKNNLFGMTFEYGLCKDSNIAATLMGVAVRNKESGNWYTFDTATNSRKNLATFKMGSFPILLLPETSLVTGDLIKMNGNFFYVKAVNANKTLTLIDAATGMIQEMLPEENILLNTTMYTKVIAFDTKTLTDASSNQGVGNNLLAAVCMMNWAKGSGDEFSLDDINDDSFNGLGTYLLLANSSGGIFGGANGGAMDITKLMALGAISGDDDMDGFGQMMVISSLLGGNNPLAGVMPQTAAPAVAISSEDYACEKCGKTYPGGTNFCSACGGKVVATTTTCPSCNAAVGKDDAFCSACGANLKKAVCSNCGKELAPDAKFCSACGNNLSAPPVEPPVVEGDK